MYHVYKAFEYRDSLRAAGGTWDETLKAWSISDSCFAKFSDDFVKALRKDKKVRLHHLPKVEMLDWINPAMLNTAEAGSMTFSLKVQTLETLNGPAQAIVANFFTASGLEVAAVWAHDYYGTVRDKAGYLVGPRAYNRYGATELIKTAIRQQLPAEFLDAHWDVLLDSNSGSDEYSFLLGVAGVGPAWYVDTPSSLRKAISQYQKTGLSFSITEFLERKKPYLESESESEHQTPQPNN